MTDEEWTTGNKPVAANSSPGRPGQGVRFTTVSNVNRLPRLYRTAHLIIYYFIEIEGEKGVTKLRKFLEENRRNLDRLEQLQQEFEDYEKALVAFKSLPGVTELPDGGFRYPSNLTPPKAPTGAPPDLNSLKLGGLKALLDGESAEVVGERIESALQKDLRMYLDFR
jgi:DNA-dependent RNA polymerase auxiliary subunit epsilon